MEGSLMKRLLLVSTMIACCSTSVAMAQIAPGENPDAGTERVAPGQPAPLDESQLRERMAASAVGRVAVRAVQGTPNGPAIGVAPVEILLYHRGQVVHSQKAELDEHGVVVLEGLPVAMEVTPVVQVAYGGVFYQETGSNLSPKAAEATIEVTVYETTDERPEWHILMRHVQIERSEAGLLVSEMIQAENPGNRTWLGDPVDDSEDAKRDAAQFRLPKGATEVQLIAGFHGWCCTTLDETGLMSVQMPMMPGKAQYRFAYILPPTKSKADLLLSAPVSTDHIIAFFADDGSEITLSGMKDAGSEAMGSTNVRMFQADSLLPGQVAGLSFAGVPGATDLAAVSDANSQIKVYAAIGGGLVLLAGIVAIFLKSPKPAQATT